MGAGPAASFILGLIPKPQEAGSLASVQALGSWWRKRMPVDSWLLPPLPSCPFREARKVQASSSTVAFGNWKLPRGVWTRVKFSAVPKPINALLAASGLHLLPIQPGSSPPLS